jgi:para-aminobenzoate synthetase component 1
VEDLFGVSEFRNISHMYSTITGRLDIETPSGRSGTQRMPDFPAMMKIISLIKNCFPPGSMTGAPKIRAMEICSELERHKRGIYSGILGYFDPGGQTLCEFSVVIRTIIIQGNKFEFQVGGGIIYDSEPEKEWAETMLKAEAIAKVLGIGEKIKEL